MESNIKVPVLLNLINLLQKSDQVGCKALHFIYLTKPV